MKSSLMLVGCAVLGLVFGYGLTAAVTQARLAEVVQSAESLDLQPTGTTSQPSGIVPAAGGSCG